MQLLQQDQDAASEILLGHFISKYHTQAVILDFNATSDIPQVRTLNKIRMGTSWVMGEMDDHKGVDYAIGRVYGDVKGEYGDLIFHGSKQPKTPLVIPSERGVKKVWRLPLKSSQPYLYFSDGWVAAYGKKAKARLKRLFWRDGRPQVELVLNQNKEFTFFDLWVSQEDQKRGPLLWARGNQFISLVEMKKQGMWIAHPLHRLPPVVNVAVGHYEGQWYVCMPQEKKTQIQPLTLPW